GRLIARIAQRHASCVFGGGCPVIVDVVLVPRTVDADDRKAIPRGHEVAITLVDTDDLGAAMADPVSDRVAAEPRENRDDDRTGADGPDDRRNDFRNAWKNDCETIALGHADATQ